MGEQTRQGKVALIVDDSPATCAVLEDLLGDAGYVVRVENGVERALQALATDGFDIVFLDMMMPEAPGWSMGSIIRDFCHKRAIPIVFISGIPPAWLRDLASAHGASACLSKPFSMVEFHQALHNLDA